MPTYIELPVPADLIADRAGNIQRAAGVTVYLRDTATPATHSATAGDGTDTTTGGLIVRSDGSIGTATTRRYFQHGVPVDVTVSGRTRGVEPWSAAAVESGGVSPSELAALAAKVPDDTDFAAISDLQMIAYAEATGKFIYKNPLYIDPADGYWGDFTRLADSTATVQKAVNAAITGDLSGVDAALAGAKPITTRTAKWPIRFGPRPDEFGCARIDSKIKVYAVNGLVFEGGGKGGSIFRAGAAGMDHVFDFNGCSDSSFKNFRVDGAAGATVTSAINVDSISTVASNLGEHNLFENIQVLRGLDFVYGWTIGALGPSNAQDTYHHQWINCWVAGEQPNAKHFTANTTSGSDILTSTSYPAGGTLADLVNGDAITGPGIPVGATITNKTYAANSVQISANATITDTTVAIRRTGWNAATYWQACFKLGGAFGSGNVLHHSFLNCTGQSCVKGLWTTGVGFHWKNGNMISCGTDFFGSAINVGDPIVIEGCRSEESGCILDFSAGSVSGTVSLRDYGYASRQMAADNVAIKFTCGGTLVCERVNISGCYEARSPQPLVMIGSANSGQLAHFKDCSFESPTGAAGAHPIVWLTEAGTTRRGTWIVEGQGAIATSDDGDVLRGEMYDRPIAGPLSNRDRTASLFAFPATATNGNAVLVSGSSTASARIREGSTITGPNIPAATYVVSVSGNNITMSAAATGSGTSAAHAVIIYRVDVADKCIAVTSMITGGCEVWLPELASVHIGHTLTVVDESGTAATNNITVNGDGVETINGAGTLVLSTNYGKTKIMRGDTQWIVVG